MPEQPRYYPYRRMSRSRPPRAAERHSGLDRKLGSKAGSRAWQGRRRWPLRLQRHAGGVRAARTALADALEERGRDATLPDALATMWTWGSRDRAEAERVLADVPGFAPQTGSRATSALSSASAPRSTAPSCSGGVGGDRLPARLPVAAGRSGTGQLELVAEAFG